MARKKLTMDGNNAAGHVSYAFTDVAAIYPITPSSVMAEVTDSWSTAGRKNIFGEQVKVVKSDDSSYLQMFSEKKAVVALNQNRLLKRDTVLSFNNERYHSYVQVNPTSYKVLKASFNDDGVEVDNVYYDNILHLSVFNGSRKVFSSNILKSEFADYVPAGVLNQTIFSDLTFSGIDKEGLHYNAILVIPDSQTNYVVEFIVAFNGKVVKRVRK